MADEFDDIPGDDPSDPRIRARVERLVPDAVKKLALAGVGALFMTEEGIRNVVGELKLPKDTVAGLLDSTDRARRELFRMIAGELRDFLEHANLSGELAKALTGITVDVNASISFRPNEDGDVVPKVKSTVKTNADDPPDAVDEEA